MWCVGIKKNRQNCPKLSKSVSFYAGIGHHRHDWNRLLVLFLKGDTLNTRTSLKIILGCISSKKDLQNSEELQNKKFLLKSVEKENIIKIYAFRINATIPDRNKY